MALPASKLNLKCIRSISPEFSDDSSLPRRKLTGCVAVSSSYCCSSLMSSTCLLRLLFVGTYTANSSTCWSCSPKVGLSHSDSIYSWETTWIGAITPPKPCCCYSYTNYCTQARCTSSGATMNVDPSPRYTASTTRYTASMETLPRGNP